MKNIMFPIAFIILVASTTFAADFQGEVVKIKGKEIVIEIFGDERVSFNAGSHVRLKTIPKGVPTLDMLKG